MSNEEVLEPVHYQVKVGCFTRNSANSVSRESHNLNPKLVCDPIDPMSFFSPAITPIFVQHSGGLLLPQRKPSSFN
jgi:hypothetical protein